MRQRSYDKSHKTVTFVTLLFQTLIQTYHFTKLWVIEVYIFFYIFVSLKKLIAILFLSIYLVSVTEVHEFFKLPQLVEHFIEHQTKDQSTTFIDFLVMHYSSSNDGDNDGSKDSQLPFKSHHDCENLANTGFITFNNYCLVIKSVPIETKIINTHSIDFISSSYLSAIWQPPKSC